jgi:hypothetical protein
MNFFPNGLNKGKLPKERPSKEAQKARQNGTPVNIVAGNKPLPRQRGLSLGERVERWLASFFSRPIET